MRFCTKAKVSLSLIILTVNARAERSPIITLTTDFGLADHYVGTMKGVLLSHSPRAQLVDITHQIPPFSIVAGAYAIAQAWSYFPPGTVHLVVVDPGVGTSRRPVIVETSGHIFVAPDNGVLGLAAIPNEYQAVEIVNFPPVNGQRSQTFHGRDVFAPVAARLAAGAALPGAFGPRIDRLQAGPALHERQTNRGWHGVVLSIDRFGNVITSFGAKVHAAIAEIPFRIQAGSDSVDRFYPTFGAAAAGVPFAYFGSSGFVEIGVNRGNASSALNIKIGDDLLLSDHNRSYPE